MENKLRKAEKKACEDVEGMVKLCGRGDASVAQLVEQLTLNQFVHGSSPCGGNSEVGEGVLSVG